MSINAPASPVPLPPDPRCPGSGPGDARVRIRRVHEDGCTSRVTVTRPGPGRHARPSPRKRSAHPRHRARRAHRCPTPGSPRHRRDPAAATRPARHGPRTASVSPAPSTSAKPPSANSSVVTHTPSAPSCATPSRTYTTPGGTNAPPNALPPNAPPPLSQPAAPSQFLGDTSS